MKVVALLAAASLVVAVPAAAAPDPAVIAAAVAASDRRDGDRELDASRKPAEVLAFFGLEAGMDAADIIPGEGYYSDIMAHVVGPDGSVTVLQALGRYRF